MYSLFPFSDSGVPRSLPLPILTLLFEVPFFVRASRRWNSRIHAQGMIPARWQKIDGENLNNQNGRINEEEISSSGAWRTMVYIEFEEKGQRLKKAVTINYLSPRFWKLKLLSNLIHYVKKPIMLALQLKK